jgi:DNA-binding response OmpR family regulator
MSKRIMVFNDTEEILQLFYDLLTPEGYAVSLHSYSTRELDDVRRIEPDLIVSDHPPFREEEGWQFIQKLKMSPDTEHIPVLLCTTNIKWLRANVDEGLLAAKRISVLPKPFNVDELFINVRALIAGPDDPAPGPLVEGTSATHQQGDRARDESDS